MESKANLNKIDIATPENAFNRYADMVYRLAFVRTKNTSDSDDILQEVFLRYMKVWEKMESEEHIKAMLIRITINCSNSLKTSSWFTKTEQLSDKIPAETAFKDNSVLEAVLGLPLKYRTAIHLHYYCGYSVNEIAKSIKSNPSTVKTHLSRARQMLKEILKEENYV